MGGAWLERTLRFGRTKKISEVFKQRKNPAKRMNDKRGNTEKLKEVSKIDRKPEKKRDRKLYPLRGRGVTTDGDGLSCHVLLTRLEESVQEKQQRSTDRDQKEVQRQSRASHKAKHKKGKSGKKKEKSLPKTQSKLRGFNHTEGVHMAQPRKRRLASLNAEAVNSLLLERATDPQPPAKQPRRLDDLPGGVVVSSDGDPCQGIAPACPKVPRGSVHRTSMSCKLEAHQSSSSKQARKSKGVRDGGAMGMSPESLDAPAPRRLAGLNAAALLKLTSLSASSKQRARATAATVVSECRGSAATASQHNSRVKLKNQVHRQKGKARLLYLTHFIHKASHNLFILYTIFILSAFPFCLLHQLRDGGVYSTNLQMTLEVE